jgi:cadmium resistance protein CadD (predicted permease)
MSTVPLEQLAAAFGLAVALFMATNVDDIFLLLALYGSSRYTQLEILAGQLLGMGALIALSGAGALLAVAIAPKYVGLLGFVPLAFGVVQLVRKRDAEEARAPAATRSGALRTLSIATITVANGGDNVGIYIPMFTTARGLELAIYALTMLALTGVLCWVARALAHHPLLGAPIRRYAGPATPFVLIALGLYILVKMRAYAVFSAA